MPLFIVTTIADFSRRTLATILLEFPVSIIEGANLTGLQPTRDAMEMESVITDTPSYGTLLAGSRCLVCLTFDT